MTDEELVKALLNCCGREKIEQCKICPYVDKGCLALMELHAYDLINRQKAEIERLKGWQDLLKAEKHSLIKYEAVKNFAERLCEGRVCNDPVVIAVKVELKEWQVENVL